uniref:Uncharacterized protein n=1 Tax=Capra hircus TaxID=9925 RepID=A0A8C2SDI5_CAPHI
MTGIKYQGGRGANYVAEISACSANVSATINAKGFSPSFDSLYEFLDFPGGSVVKNICCPTSSNEDLAWHDFCFFSSNEDVSSALSLA